MSEFSERFTGSKKKHAYKAVVTEAKIRSVQLKHGKKQYDTEDRELRHASQLWHEAYRCWHRYKNRDCDYKWDEAKHSESNMCYWCDRDDFVQERNAKADNDGIRWIPPKKLHSHAKPVDSRQPGAVHMSYVHAKMLRRESEAQ